MPTSSLTLSHASTDQALEETVVVLPTPAFKNARTGGFNGFAGAWFPTQRGEHMPDEHESLVTPESYEQQFHTLVQAGYNWTNLSLHEVHEDSLVVGIEFSSESSKVPPGKTSINFSGPAIRNGKVDWQLRFEPRSENDTDAP